MDKKLESFQGLMREEREVDKEDRLLTMSQAAEFLQISKQSLYKYRAQGKLKGFKRLGRRVLILQSDCLRSLKDYGPQHSS